MARPQVRQLQEFGEILKDLALVLNRKAWVKDLSEHEIDWLIRSVLPALCRRVCELAARVDPGGSTVSTNLMVCHDNVGGCLRLRIMESFPGFGLDTTVRVNNEFWDLHTRAVHYGDSANAPRNRIHEKPEVIEEALINGRNVLREVDDSTLQPSDSHANVRAVWALIPSMLEGGKSDLSQIERGRIVGLNINIHDDIRGIEGYQTIVELGRRIEDVRTCLGRLFTLSAYTVIPKEKRHSAISAFASWVKSQGEAAVRLTLEELVKKIVSWTNS